MPACHPPTATHLINIHLQNSNYIFFLLSEFLGECKYYFNQPTTNYSLSFKMKHSFVF